MCLEVVLYKGYSGGTTPLKQKDTYALCVPSFMLSCFSERTGFQAKNERSTSLSAYACNKRHNASTMLYNSGMAAALHFANFSRRNGVILKRLACRQAQIALQSPTVAEF